MKFKRAILTGALGWAIIFFEVCILMFGFKLQPGLAYYSIHYIFILVLAIFLSYVYFKKASAKGSKQGLAIGVIFIVTGTILDAIITIPLFLNYNYAFFLDPYLLAGYLEIIIATTVYAALK